MESSTFGGCFAPLSAAVMSSFAEIGIVPARHHPAFPVPNRGHINGEISFGYSELFASAQVRCHPRTVNNVLARETGYVRARSADVFTVDRRDTLSLLSKGPGGGC